jgi:4a-hydroxytetrahydrobiopterin dehydratase
MAKLALRHCTPIKKGTTPISTAIARSLIKQLSPGWSFNHGGTGVEQEFRFKNFHETMGFVNAVAWIANTEDHHPELEVGYNRCKITFTTHAAGGLTVNDFICAAKVDAIYQNTLPEATAEKTQAIIESPVMEPRPKTGTVARPAPQTAEKTQAIIEPSRAKTGTTPRPAPQTARLDMDEAEELLNIEIRAPELEPAPASAEDEIILTDPDDEPTLPHLQGKSVFKTPAAEPAGRNPESTMRYGGEPEEEDSQPEEHFRSTVILPPGMQNVSARKQDQDEEATVIAHPEIRDDTEFTVDEDEVRTMLMPGMQDEADTEEKEDPKLLKTMIIKPPLRDEHDAADPDETVLFDPKLPGKHKSK